VLILAAVAKAMEVLSGAPNSTHCGVSFGTAAAAKSAPDGYTLLLVPTSHVINPSIYAKLPL